MNKINNSISQLLEKEKCRQQNTLSLIASENLVPKNVIEVEATCLMNKYAEGYNNNRYYSGCRIVNEIEDIAIQNAQKLFGAKYVNVQPHSGSSANFAIYFALLNPGDKIMGLALPEGGHLTHGHPANFSGKWFDSHFYHVDTHGVLDMHKIRQEIETIRPKLIITGASAYPLEIDFAQFADIAKSVNAILLADISHIAGLIAAGEHSNPLPYADVVMTTTHKTLRGPRGAIIMTNDEHIAKKIKQAVFPGTQGGPFMNIIAAKAIAFENAQTLAFKQYIQQMKKNAVVMSHVLCKLGIDVTVGTETHMLLLSLDGTHFSRNSKDAVILLEQAGVIVNKNMIRNDTSPTNPSGIRIGTPVITSRGINEYVSMELARYIGKTLQDPSNADKLQEYVQKVCIDYPLTNGDYI